MVREYTENKPTHFLSPVATIKKGDKLLLDITVSKYYVTINPTDKPLKFEVTSTTWSKLARNSKNI